LLPTLADKGKAAISLLYSMSSISNNYDTNTTSIYYKSQSVFHALQPVTSWTFPLSSMGQVRTIHKSWYLDHFYCIYR
jgi:hypothetical protein